jgi:hypothetical protein
MAIRYKIFDDKKFVYVTADKVPEFSEQLEHLETLANDPKYIAPMKKLVDFSKIGQIGLTNEEIDEYMGKKAQYKDKFKGERTAVVVNNDLDFGISRIFYVKMDNQKFEMNVFRTVDEALQWLDIKLDKTEMHF